MARSVRFRRSSSRDDELTGLAGWLYTDLMLGLVVIFLGASVISLPALIGPDASPIPPEVNDSVVTTTTTEPPVPLCRSLYSSPGVKAREDGIWIVMRMTSPVTDAVANEFLGLFQGQIDEEAAKDPGSVLAGRQASETHIGLVIASGGASSTQDVGPALGEARAFVEGLRRLLPGILAESDSYSEAIVRPGGTQTIQKGYVGMDIFPYVEAPCFD